MTPWLLWLRVLHHFRCVFCIEAAHHRRETPKPRNLHNNKLINSVLVAKSEKSSSQTNKDFLYYYLYVHHWSTTETNQLSFLMKPKKFMTHWWHTITDSTAEILDVWQIGLLMTHSHWQSLPLLKKTKFTLIAKKNPPNSRSRSFRNTKNYQNPPISGEEWWIQK